jgi:hypothetical protein
MAFGYLLRNVVEIRVEGKTYTNDSYGKERERREKKIHKNMKIWQCLLKSERSAWAKRNSWFSKKPKMT